MKILTIAAGTKVWPIFHSTMSAQQIALYIDAYTIIDRDIDIRPVITIIPWQTTSEHLRNIQYNTLSWIHFPTVVQVVLLTKDAYYYGFLTASENIL